MALLLAGPRNRELILVEGDLHVGVEGATQLAAGALHRHRFPSSWSVTPFGTVTGFLPIRDIGASYQTTASSSPPRLAVRASRSVISPRGVETMAMPRPFLTRGSSRHLT